MMNGFILLQRKVCDWEWYKDVPTCKLWFHILLRANRKETEYKGETVPRGGLVTTLNTLADETGLSKQEVRTALGKLKKTGEIAVKPNRQYSIITVEKYVKYQAIKTETQEQHMGNTEKKPAVRFVPPTVEEVAAYCRERGNQVDAEKFHAFYSAKGWKIGKNSMKDWKAAVRTWEQKDKEQAPAKPKSRIINGVRVYD